MSRKILIALFCLATAVNALALAANLSSPSRAAVTHRKLLNDPDFAQAVKAVIEGCAVNLDTGKVKC